uniref:Gliding motility-associated C-terminal domain-containing protein n=1 Tax=Roseihalotalea indica TaxID=2867963 RepID=A0AA49GPS5_9BACT|nr:gliding motility-associated C-terminal domain-containing protein [Tunicatimonas sp. TK19036]
MTNQGILTNQGTISVPGDWSNTRSYAGDGKVVLVGADDQLIQHQNQTFGTLVVEGGGRKILESPVNIADTLYLTLGLLEASSANVIQLLPEATVDGGNAESYVLGPIQCSGTGYRYIPIGTEEEFAPLVLEDVQGVNPRLQVSVISPNPDSEEGERLERISQYRYWNLELIDGSFDGSLATLPVSSEDGFSDLVGAVVAQADKVGGPYTNLGQSTRQGTPQDGWVTSRLPVNQSILALGLTTEYAVENSVVVPSAFAPQAQNVEDRQLKVYAVNLVPDQFSFIIFNRWGQVVYQTDVLSEALAEGWNGIGSQTNDPVPAGVYHYVLRGRFETNQTVEKTGSITLFR